MRSGSSNSRRIAKRAVVAFILASFLAPVYAVDGRIGVADPGADSLLQFGQSFQMFSATGRGGDLLFADRFEQVGDPFSCTLANWSDQIGLTESDVGTPPDYRRYSGPCALRVQGGDVRYVTNFLPSLESSLVVRFYFFPELFTPPALLYSADDDGINFIELWYNLAGPNTLTLRLFDSSKNSVDMTALDIPVGQWYYVEFSWLADTNAEINFAVVGDVGQSQFLEVNTGGVVLETQRLGLINGNTVGGSVDFDAFESRRTQAIGQLIAGDVLGDGVFGARDLVKLINELDGDDLALGQPDCNRDGEIDEDDFLCVLSIIASQPSPNPFPGL